MRHKLAMLADGKFTAEAMRVLVSIQDEVVEQVAKSRAHELSPLEVSDREDEIGEWLEDHDIPGAWDYAPTFVGNGYLAAFDFNGDRQINSLVDYTQFKKRLGFSFSGFTPTI